MTQNTRYVELDNPCHKSSCLIFESLNIAVPGLQPDRRITWKQVRFHVLCVDRQRVTVEKTTSLNSSLPDIADAAFWKGHEPAETFLRRVDCLGMM
jgi:hypothetical protein